MKGKPIEPSIKKEMAMFKYRPLNEGKAPRKNKDVAAEYGHPVAVCWRAIKSAFKEKLVEFHELPYRVGPQRDEELEDSLKSEFELGEAVVVDLEMIELSKDVRPDGKRYGDLVHEQLGMAMAAHISSSPGSVFRRSGDVIGLSPGRGVYRTVHSLKSCPKFRVFDITLQSLSGIMHSLGEQSRRTTFHVDADDQCNALSPFFDGKVTLNTISQRITQPTEARSKSDWKRIFEGTSWMKPNAALVGVGALGPGHRLFEAAKAPEDEQKKDILYPILPDIIRLVNACDAVSEECKEFCPVGDIANLFFPVYYHKWIDGRPPTSSLEQYLTEVEALIKKINERLLTAKEKQFNQTALHVIAGTTRKAHAIYKLLNDENFQIETLCTDSITAKEILKIQSELMGNGD